MLRKIHFYSGIITVIIFIGTGQYMHHIYDHLKDMEIMNRALFRAGHLYILLFGLIHMALGVNFQLSDRSWIKVIPLVGSVIIFIATVLVITGFFTDLPTEEFERPLTRISLYLILLGVSLQGLTFFFKKSSLDKTNPIF